MSTISSILLILLIPLHIWGVPPISIEEFKKITDEKERAKLIEQAPPEQKEELKNIDSLHRELVGSCGGEAGLKTVRETQIARARGLGSLENVFHQQVNIWGEYIASVMIANKNAGMPPKQQAEVEKKLVQEEDVVRNRVPVVHSLVFNLAASPAALELEKKAEQLCSQLSKRETIDSSTPYQPPTTKQERMKVDKQMDAIFEQLKVLPKLTPEQAQKEFDAFGDEKVGPQQGL